MDYLRNTSRFSSLYNEDQNKNVKNGDYQVPKRDANLLIDYDLRHNKDLFQYTWTGMRSASQPARPRRSNPAAMWTAQNFYKTSYKQQQEQATSTHTNQAQRPLWSYPKAAYTSQLGFFNTEAHGTMGKYGSNPILARHEQQKKG